MASVTITVAQQSSTLTDFPVFINLGDIPSGSDFWANVTRDNMRAFDSDGGTQLPLDIYSFDSGANTGVVIVKRTLSGSSTTTIFLDTGGTSEAAVTDPLGAEAVWSDYETVIFADGENNRADFSSTVTNNGVISATPKTLPLDAVGFNSDFDRVEGPVVGNSSVFTMSATALPERTAGSVNEALLSYNNGGSLNGRATLSFRDTDQIDFWDNNNSWITLSSPVSVVANREYRVAGRHDGAGNRSLVVNGQVSGSDSGNLDIDSGADQLWLGIEDGSANESLGQGDGYVSFGYLRFDSLSDDWLEAEYQNLKVISRLLTESGDRLVTEDGNLLVTEGSGDFYTLEVSVSPRIRITESAGYALSEFTNNQRLTQSSGYGLTQSIPSSRLSQSFGYALVGRQTEPVREFEYTDPEGCPFFTIDDLNAFFEQVETDLNERLDKDSPQRILDDLPMNFRRLINVGEAVDNSDAVTYGQAKRLISEAQS